MQKTGKFDGINPHGFEVSGVSIPAGVFDGGQSVLDGKFYQAGNVPDSEFAHNPAAVGLDGLGGNVKDFGNFRAGFSIRNHLQYL